VLHSTCGGIAAASAFMFGAAGRHRQPCLAAVNISRFVVLLLNLADYPADPFVVMPV
jgi:hypothetical protein